MSVAELTMRVLSALEPMVPGMLSLLVATMAALFLLLLLCRNSWVQDANFRIAGLFFGITPRGGVRLACAWMKLVFVLVFVAMFRKLVLVQYWMLLLPGLVLALGAEELRKKISGLLWLLLQMAGLLATNLICGYIRDLSAGLVFYLVYIAMGLFLAFFSVFLFLNELSDISAARDVDARSVWGEVYEEPTGEEE